MRNLIDSGSSDRLRGWARPAAAFHAPILILLLGLLGAPSMAAAEGWGFAWEPGIITATAKGAPFVFRLTVSKYVSEEFSIGPSVYLTPAGEDAMYSGSLNANFRVPLDTIRIAPFLGVGVAHRKTAHDDDTALMFPMGLSVETPVAETIDLVGTVSINLHDGIVLEGEKDDTSVGLTVGISYRPE